MRHAIALALTALILGTIAAAPAEAEVKDTGIMHTPIGGKTNRTTEPPKGAV